ncbi:MAG: cellulase-like family protein [Planctomycetota bacterium]
MLKLDQPVAITMWDFSWLERRWPGAGYEDWGRALDELAERGYDCVRIDAYPHLVAHDPDATYELIPTWHFWDWGSPSLCDVRVMPALLEFMRCCADRGIRVALSTWYREDRHNLRMDIADPVHQADQWLAVLGHVERAGLLDTVLFLDLCNEWPLRRWAPFFVNDPPEDHGNGNTKKSQAWMREAIAHVRAAYPGLPLTYSFALDTMHPDPPLIDYLDLFEPHVWLAQQHDYYRLVGYRYEGLDIKGCEAVAAKAERVYRANPGFWDEALREAIERHAVYSRKMQRGLVTTECWGPVDYKDGPRMDWGWVKDTCAIGVETAAATGRWLGIATNNFCGPQFRGMWRDIEWHQRMTQTIKSASIDEELQP